MARPIESISEVRYSADMSLHLVVWRDRWRERKPKIWVSTTGLENWTLFSGVEIQPFDWCSSLRPHGLNLRTGKSAAGACVEQTAKRITPMMSRAIAGNSRSGRCADDGEMDRRHVPQTRQDASYLSADMLPRKDGSIGWPSTRGNPDRMLVFET